MYIGESVPHACEEKDISERKGGMSFTRKEVVTWKRRKHLHSRFSVSSFWFFSFREKFALPLWHDIFYQKFTWTRWKWLSAMLCVEKYESSCGSPTWLRSFGSQPSVHLSWLSPRPVHQSFADRFSNRTSNSDRTKPTDRWFILRNFLKILRDKYCIRLVFVCWIKFGNLYFF